MHFHLRGCHPLWQTFPGLSINAFLSFFVTSAVPMSPVRFRLPASPPLFHKRFADYCGPATPNSLFKSSGLGCSDFARHYFRNHGCFLFLQVLRWFTSLGLLQYPMYSDKGNCRSRQLGFPIQKSPDRRLLAPPRSFSQLIASFIA